MTLKSRSVFNFCLTFVVIVAAINTFATMRCQTFFFILFSFPCSANHERDWPPCKVFGLATSTLNARNNNNNYYYTILYYSILYYTILYYTILFYTILYYSILYYTVLYTNTLEYYTVLYYIIQTLSSLRLLIL